MPINFVFNNLPTNATILSKLSFFQIPMPSRICRPEAGLPIIRVLKRRNAKHILVITFFSVSYIFSDDHYINVFRNMLVKLKIVFYIYLQIY